MRQKCVDYEVDGVRHRGRPKKIWSKVVEKQDIQTRQLCLEMVYGPQEMEKVKDAVQ